MLQWQFKEECIWHFSSLTWREQLATLLYDPQGAQFAEKAAFIDGLLMQVQLEHHPLFAEAQAIIRQIAAMKQGSQAQLPMGLALPSPHLAEEELAQVDEPMRRVVMSQWTAHLPLRGAFERPWVRHNLGIGYRKNTWEVEMHC